MALIGLFISLWLTSAREYKVPSGPSLSISCSKTGLSTTIISPTYSYLNPIPGTDWIWTNAGLLDQDHCNVTMPILRHSIYEDIFLTFYSPDTDYVYVNGVVCSSMWDRTISIRSCFPLAGHYNLTLQSKHTSGAYGMAFKITENYVCPDSCSECINRQCCSLGYIMTTAGSCTCAGNLYANCDCPIGFEPAHVSITPSLFSCVAESTGEVRLKTTQSAVGLAINCSGSGNATTVSGNPNNFVGIPYIRSPSFASGDVCNVSLPYLKRSDLAIVTILFRSNQDNDYYHSLYVNDNLCRSGNTLVATDITDCFQETGIYNLTFKNPIAINSESLAFRLSESYYCLPDCADCVNDKCCPSNYVIENHDCGCEESSLSSCSCPFGFVFHRHADSQSSLYGCHRIDILED